MAKRKETLELEDKLYYMCERRRIYGCDEVTIGFAKNGFGGNGREIVDFCTMDGEGIIKCYEIKVSLSDLKSHAKKSFYGHYNYLFVTEELFNKVKGAWDNYVPAFVGIAIPCSSSWSDGVEIRRNAKKQVLSVEQTNLMKESMIRSMSYRMYKYRDAINMDKYREMKKVLASSQKREKSYYNLARRWQNIVSKIERCLRLYYGFDFSFEEAYEKLEANSPVPENISLSLTEKGIRHNEICLEEKMSL